MFQLFLHSFPCYLQEKVKPDNFLLDAVSVCSVNVYFHSLFVFCLAYVLVKIHHKTKQQYHALIFLLRYISLQSDNSPIDYFP